MRRILDTMTIVAFAGVIGIVGSVGYVYTNQDSIIEQLKEAAMGEVGNMLPGILGGSTDSPLPIGGDSPLPVELPSNLPF